MDLSDASEKNPQRHDRGSMPAAPNPLRYARPCDITTPRAVDNIAVYTDDSKEDDSVHELFEFRGLILIFLCESNRILSLVKFPVTECNNL